jgi:beta-lactamase class D
MNRRQFLQACAGAAVLPSLTDVIARPDLEKRFTEAGCRGTLVTYDLASGQTTIVNPARAGKGFVPASTFKVFNALVSLETGVIRDEKEVIPWDGIKRSRVELNRNHTLASGMRISALPHFQELARRVGPRRMKAWLDRVGYGNRSMAGPADLFWLEGGLRISAREQVAFLRRLYEESLPFSKRSMRIVKRILRVEETPRYRLHAKTGWALKPSEVGWWVGWMERGGKATIFAANLEPAREGVEFGPLRTAVPRALLKELGVL